MSNGRLTPKREAEIRKRARESLPLSEGDGKILLAELDAVRAELPPEGSGAWALCAMLRGEVCESHIELHDGPSTIKMALIAGRLMRITTKGNWTCASAGLFQRFMDNEGWRIVPRSELTDEQRAGLPEVAG